MSIQKLFRASVVIGLTIALVPLLLLLFSGLGLIGVLANTLIPLVNVIIFSLKKRLISERSHMLRKARG